MTSVRVDTLVPKVRTFDMDAIVISIAGIVMGYVTAVVLLKNQTNEKFSDDDHRYAVLAATNLHSDLINSKILDISDEDIDSLMKSSRIIMAKHLKNQGKEGMEFSNPVNTRYWPYYHYTFPYQYTEGGAWPPNMYSRLYNWQPGYDTAGWSYWMRPGMSYVRWPRNRWVHNNSSYYFINNGGEKQRSQDYIQN